MEKDGFSAFEVEEYLQQIRTQLANNNEQQAKNIIVQIIGDASCNIQFPSSVGSSSKSDRAVFNKIEEIKNGMFVTVSQVARSLNRRKLHQLIAFF